MIAPRIPRSIEAAVQRTLALQSARTAAKTGNEKKRETPARALSLSEMLDIRTYDRRIAMRSRPQITEPETDEEQSNDDE